MEATIGNGTICSKAQFICNSGIYVSTLVIMLEMFKVTVSVVTLCKVCHCPLFVDFKYLYGKQLAPEIIINAFPYEK